MGKRPVALVYEYMHVCKLRTERQAIDRERGRELYRHKYSKMEILCKTPQLLLERCARSALSRQVGMEEKHRMRELSGQKESSYLCWILHGRIQFEFDSIV